MPAVNPEILKWAREKADLSLEEAAHAIGLNDAYGKTGAERLAALEAGEEEPSRSKLVAMSQKYRRPLLVFYLKEPPRLGDRGKDFRTVPGALPPSYDATLDALIRDIKSRHSLIRSLLEDEDASPQPFVESVSMSASFKSVADQIVKTFSFNLNEFRKQRTIENAFKYLRSQMEASGIFVMLAGNLGSHHSNISPAIFRGFAIADPLAPLIVINDQDAHSAWSFTALHEATHLWLGTTGISGATNDIGIERFCNDVAGEILLPKIELQELLSIRSANFEDAVNLISDFANKRKISRAMVAYKLYRTDYIEEKRWRELHGKFQQEWLENHKKNTNKDGEGTGGPTFYVLRRHRLGNAVLGVVNRAVTEGSISYTKAGQILGVKARNVKPLLKEGN